MTFGIKINDFEGPFDLLLHLIKKNEMDIYDIKIYEITNQYLTYLKQMEEMDLEITSEFIVIAATLLEIKSKLLVPQVKNEDTVETAQDPRKELVDKLVEYRKFKLASEFLRKRERAAGTTYAKRPETIDDKEFVRDNKELFKNITLLDLYNIFNSLMDAFVNKMNKETVLQRQISVEQHKIEDKMIEIKHYLESKPNMNFSDVVVNCSSKIEVVVSFLAMLELIKLRDIKIYQENNFSEIYLERIIENEAQ